MAYTNARGTERDDIADAPIDDEIHDERDDRVDTDEEAPRGRHVDSHRVSVSVSDSDCHGDIHRDGERRPPLRPDDALAAPAAPRVVTAEAAWWRLWHEPWVDAHPEWLDMMAEQDPWAAKFRRASPSLRLGYPWFCRRHQIDDRIGLPREWHTGMPMDLRALPLSGPRLARAAIAIGRVGYVSHCMSQAREQLARLFSPEASADASPWRDALRQARARPLLTLSDAPIDNSEPALQRWALPLMAQLIDERVPGAWSRLRLRLAPDLSGGIAPHGATVLPDAATALRRQAWRLWHSSALL
ncbi:hypothetical protein [Roseateles amylovorans]|uniref:Type III secretion protein n=1 Tax=Roseateles amylovorans TaxID=2978473 RepID=A0ABY6B2A4_9BURK|nr:hypothetical protein [Roseateles amylovorans]UXH79531.1 hypothetical protein N4261_06300 [Roseateles amylovorans]